MSRVTEDRVCKHCGGRIQVLGHLGNIEYAGCLDCKADATINTDKE